MNIEETITDLQMRLAFQEEMIGQLNDVVVNQDKQLLDMQKQLAAVIKKLRVINPQQGLPNEEAPPPHY